MKNIFLLIFLFSFLRMNAGTITESSGIARHNGSVTGAPSSKEASANDNPTVIQKSTSGQIARVQNESNRHYSKSKINKQTKVESAPEKKTSNQIVALILAIFLGGLGIHRFYLGYVGVGILMLLTGGLFGILWFIDIIRIALGDLGPKNGSY